MRLRLEGPKEYNQNIHSIDKLTPIIVYYLWSLPTVCSRQTLYKMKICHIENVF